MVRAACEHFFGKSLEQAVELFRSNHIYYQEDLRWMGPRPFRFYLPAAIRFIRHETDDISGFIALFAGTLEFRLEHEAQKLKPVAAQLVELCDFLLEQWSKYGTGTEVYGDLRVRYRSLRESLSRLET